MNKKHTIVTTQYRENYGAHQWDGEGECPQYWKNKGGDTYIVLSNCDCDDNDIRQLFTYSSDYSETSICGCLKVDTLKDAEEKYFEPWENIVTIGKNPDGTFTKSSSSNSESCARRGLTVYTHTHVYAKAKDHMRCEPIDYKVFYQFENDMQAHSEEEALAIFEKYYS